MNKVFINEIPSNIPEIRGIYKFTNLLDGKIYIGRTKNTRKRYTQHRSSKTDQHISNAIRIYGIDNFSFEILEEVPIYIDLKSIETKWIREFDSTNLEKGYNKIEKDEDLILCSLDVPPEEISRRMRVRKENYQKRGGHPSKGKKRDPRITQKTRQTKIDRGTNEKRKKPVFQIDKNSGKIVSEFPSIKEAAIITRIAEENICDAAKKKRRLKHDKRNSSNYWYTCRTAGGYIWEYKNQKESE